MMILTAQQQRQHQRPNRARLRHEPGVLLFLLISALSIALTQLLLAHNANDDSPATISRSFSLRSRPPSKRRSTLQSPAENDGTLSGHQPPPPPRTNKNKLLPQWNHDAARAEIPTTQFPHGGAFVHMGKTGGSTLSLQLRNGCHSFLPHPCRNITTTTTTGPELPASWLIQSYYHVPDFAFLQQSQHSFLVLTARDPYDRTVSAFVYEHIRNRDARNEPIDPPEKRPKYEAAYQCFADLETFVGYLGTTRPDESMNFDYPYHKREVHPESCRDLARAALHGRVKLFNHFYFGFDRIRSFLVSAAHEQSWSKSQWPDIYVARQEKLTSDWNQINDLLEQSYRVELMALKNNEIATNETVAASVSSTGASKLDPHQPAAGRNTTALALPVTRHVSPAGQRALCYALKAEYQAYFWFLKRARNLQQPQRPGDNTNSVKGNDEWEFSLNRAKERCGAHLDMDALAEAAAEEDK